MSAVDTIVGRSKAIVIAPQEQIDGCVVDHSNYSITIQRPGMKDSVAFSFDNVVGGIDELFQAIPLNWLLNSGFNTCLWLQNLQHDQFSEAELITKLIRHRQQYQHLRSTKFVISGFEILGSSNIIDLCNGCKMKSRAVSEQTIVGQLQSTSLDSFEKAAEFIRALLSRRSQLVHFPCKIKASTNQESISSRNLALYRPGEIVGSAAPVVLTICFHGEYLQENTIFECTSRLKLVLLPPTEVQTFQPAPKELIRLMTYETFSVSERKASVDDFDRMPYVMNVLQDGMQSLSVLMRTVRILNQHAGTGDKQISYSGSTHVPFRDSVLTRLMRRELCGQCVNFLVLAVGLNRVNSNEDGNVLNGLRFATDFAGRYEFIAASQKRIITRKEIELDAATAVVLASVDVSATLEPTKEQQVEPAGVEMVDEESKEERQDQRKFDALLADFSGQLQAVSNSLDDLHSKREEVMRRLGWRLISSVEFRRQVSAFLQVVEESAEDPVNLERSEAEHKATIGYLEVVGRRSDVPLYEVEVSSNRAISRDAVATEMQTPAVAENSASLSPAGDRLSLLSHPMMPDRGCERSEVDCKTLVEDCHIPIFDDVNGIHLTENVAKKSMILEGRNAGGGVNGTFLDLAQTDSNAPSNSVSGEEKGRQRLMHDPRKTLKPTTQAKPTRAAREQIAVIRTQNKMMTSSSRQFTSRGQVSENKMASSLIVKPGSSSMKLISSRALPALNERHEPAVGAARSSLKSLDSVTTRPVTSSGDERKISKTPVNSLAKKRQVQLSMPLLSPLMNLHSIVHASREVDGTAFNTEKDLDLSSSVATVKPDALRQLCMSHRNESEVPDEQLEETSIQMTQLQTVLEQETTSSTVACQQVEKVAEQIANSLVVADAKSVLELESNESLISTSFSMETPKCTEGNHGITAGPSAVDPLNSNDPVEVILQKYQKKRDRRKLDQFDDCGEDCLSPLDSMFLRHVASDQVASARATFMRGADPNAENSFGRNGLQIAARNGCVEMLAFLIDEAHCSISTRGPRGDTLFHLASWNGHLDALNWLQCRGALTEAVDAFGQTAAHVAARRGELEVLKYLHDRLGMNMLSEDFDGRKPVDCVPRRGLETASACTQYLERIEAKESAQHLVEFDANDKTRWAGEAVESRIPALYAFAEESEFTAT